MSATDYFLFSLTFLVSALLAGWIRHLSREQDGPSGYPSTRVRDGELARLTASLAAALSRIEALERRHEELERELGSQTGAPADAAGLSAGAADGPAPSLADGTDAVHDGHDGHDSHDVEVSPSQWRSAMDRLGPAWQSGSRLTDPDRQTSPVEGGDLSTRRDLELAPSPPRLGAPLDDLFPPPAPFVEGA